MKAKLVELIETETCEGTGKEEDVRRTVRRWWSKAGELAAERDEWREESLAKELAECYDELAAIKLVLDDQLGNTEPTGLRTRVLVAALGCKKWLEYQQNQAANAKRQREARERSKRRPKK